MSYHIQLTLLLQPCIEGSGHTRLGSAFVQPGAQG